MPNYTITMVFLTAILALSIAAIYFSRKQAVSQRDLLASREKEAMQQNKIISIVNTLSVAVLSTDSNGIIDLYNAASLNLLDTNTGLNGKAIDDVVKLHTRDASAIRFFDAFTTPRSTVVRDDLAITINDEAVLLEITCSPTRTNFNKSRSSADQDGYIIILRDITKSKSLAEERDEFISVISHELRTPITIAEGTLSNTLLMIQRDDMSKEATEKSVVTAHDQVLFLSKMVNDLSTLSRAERSAADTPEVIHIRHLIDDLYHEYAPQAEARGLALNLDLTPHLGHVTVSPLYLKELLQNFITNSLKYTKEGSITLRVQRKESTVVFDVRDTGIGISKSDQDKIFHKFYRSEDYRTRETGGTGLGLYVCAKLAKKLGAKITVVSRLNHGSSFSFELPLTEKDTK
jgi:signal transduction histidine kinase